MNQDSLKAILFILGLVLIASAKLWLVWDFPISVQGGSVFDDELFLLITYEILQGNWLGEYNSLILIKGPGYPLFISASHLTGLPLLWVQHLFYILASLLVVIALRPIMKSKILLTGLFILIVFNPQTYEIFTLRVIREGIYPALTLMVVASLFGLTCRLGGSLRQLTLWSIATGFFLFLFWITREEGIWIIPAIICLIGYGLFELRRKSPSDFVKRMAIYAALPACIFFLATATISTVNYLKYGIFCITEQQTTEFKQAYGALTRVNHAIEKRMVPVPKETRQRIYRVSPTFSILAPHLEGDLGNSWEKASAYALPKESKGEIGGGWFVWALRTATSFSGYHVDAPGAAAFYAKIAKEVNQACDNGSLDCGPRRTSLVSPWRESYLPLLRKRLWHSIKMVASFSFIKISEGRSVGDSSFGLFYNITRSKLAPTSYKYADVKPRIRHLHKLQSINLAYQRVIPLFFIISLLIAVSLLFRQFFSGVILSNYERKQRIIKVFSIFLLIAILTRLALLAYLDITAFPTARYFAPLYPMLLLFCFLSGHEGIQIIKSHFGKNGKKGNFVE